VRRGGVGHPGGRRLETLLKFLDGNDVAELVNSHPAMDERRPARRIFYRVEARIEGLDRGHDCTLADLSTSGAFIDTRTVFPVGRRGRISFVLGEREIAAEMEVAYSMPGVGMGVKFIDLPAEERALIEDLLKKQS
jgi:hypothetical protein